MNRTSSPALAPWRRLLALLLALMMALPAAAQVRLPSLGEAAHQDLSVADERRVGEQIMREGRRDPAYLDDPVLLEYLNGLWLPLVQAARDKGEIEPELDRSFSWEAFLVRDRSVNAFALPGGYVGIHLGLIALAATPDQLASVLAHELTHITQRHIARSIAPQQRASLLALAGVLAAIAVAGRSNNADGANAAFAGSQALAIQSQLNFSRDMEREADRIGLGVLTAAGFAPAGMATMFESMDQSSRLSDSTSYPYLRSHPLTLNRISEARDRVLLVGGAAPVPTALHAVMQMRARVLMDDGAQALQKLRGESSSNQPLDQLAALYGGAMAASLLREHGRAQRLADQALQQASQLQGADAGALRPVLLLRAELALARQDRAAALLALDAVNTASATSAASSSPLLRINDAHALAPSGFKPGFKLSQRAPLLLRAQALLLGAPQVLSATPVSGRPGAATVAGSGLAAAAEVSTLTSEHAADLRSVTESLQTWLADVPHDALAWEMLSGTAGALGLRLRSLRASAEARAVLGDLTGAIDRLRAAQQVSRGAVGQDFIEASVIDTRLREITALRRQLVLDARGGNGRNRGEPRDEPGEGPRDQK